MNIKNNSIKNSFHFSNLVGIRWKVLKDIINNPSGHYSRFFLYQKSGKKRILHAPSFELKLCQDYIYRNILKNVKLANSAHGFINEKSIVTNASCHQDSQSCLNVDIKDFFTSIHNNRVYYVFRYICGYSKKISYMFTRLCTLDNKLPQGAITSPVLSNIVSYKMDIRIEELCKKRHLIYTRYADDITISGAKSEINSKLLSLINIIVNSEGFDINRKKTKFYVNDLKITGLIISNKILKVPNRYKKKVDSELFFIEKYGLLKQIHNLDWKVDEELMGFDEKKVAYLRVLSGKILWISSVEKESGGNFYKRFKAILLKEM